MSPQRAASSRERVEALAEEARACARARPVESLEIADRALGLADSLGEPAPRAAALRARGLALWAAGCSEEALTALEEGAAEAERAGDPLLAARIPIIAVDALARLGRHEEALALARSLEERLAKLGADEDAAKVAANTGNVYFAREAFAEALEAWERARAFFSARGDSQTAAQVQVNIANVLTQLHRLREAAAQYEAAAQVLEQARLHAVVAGIRGNLGFLHLVAGDYSASLREFQAARSLFTELGLESDVARCDRETADVHLELNLNPEALEAYDRTLPFFAQRGMTSDAARAEVGRAQALAARGRWDDALAAFDRGQAGFAAEGNELGVGRVRLLRAEARLAAGHTGPSLADDLRWALARFRHQKLAVGECRARLALCVLEGRSGRDTSAALRRLSRKARRDGLVAQQWRIDSELGGALARAGRPRAACAAFRRAVEEVERARSVLKGEAFRIAFLKDRGRPYEELLGLLLDRGTPAALREAFQVAEAAKSRALLQRLAQPVEALPDPEKASLRARLEALRDELSWAYGGLERLDETGSRLPPAGPGLSDRARNLESEYAALRRELDTGPGPAEAAAAPPNVEEIQALLGPDERLVEFSSTGDELLAFVLGPGRLRVTRGLASVRETAGLLRRLRRHWSRQAAASGESGTAEGILAELYALLIEPLESYLDVPRLTVVPHGPLHAVPFHALRHPGGWALDRWELVQAPSGAVHRECRRRPDPAGSSDLVFGVSDPGMHHLGHEIAALRRLLPRAEVREGNDARLQALPSAGSWRYLHFATHAVYRSDNPLFSGLRMADGWLIAHDLMGRRLECRLATLSACRTGMGQVAPGDEVLGLVRGFLAAGARAVAVSLWEADDRATSELMSRFYAGMAAGQTRAAALRAAQLDVRSRFPNPYHWAPFVLVGAR